jgi:hypothetical protein
MVQFTYARPALREEIPLIKTDGTLGRLYWPSPDGSEAQLEEHSLTRLPIVYQGAFKGTTVGGVFTIPPANVSTAVAPMQWHPAYVIDIEAWKLNPSRPDAEILDSIRRYVDVLRAAKAKTPNAKIGLYGVPLRNWYSALSNDPARLAELRTQFERQAPIIDASDIIFPSLYVPVDSSPSPTIDQWRKYADVNLTEIARLAGSKPVIPFLWDRHHGDKVPLTPQFYRDMLAHLIEHTDSDGIALWVESARTWGEGVTFQGLRLFLDARR